MPPSHVINFTIPSPVLQTGEHFEIKYRILGTSTWTTAADATNAPYSLSVSVIGTYEIAITLIKADSSRCDTVIYEVPITEPDCSCPEDVTATVESIVAGQWQIRINYTAFTTPPKCGMTVTYTGSDGVTRQQVFTGTIPNPIIITFAVSNQAYTVILDVDCCAGNTVRCPPLDVTPSGSKCVSSTWLEAEDQKRVQQIGGQFLMTLILTSQSIPATNNFVATYTQTNVAAGYTPDSGVFNLPGVGPNFQMPVNPRPSTVSGYTYNVTITDICGIPVTVG